MTTGALLHDWLRFSNDHTDLQQFDQRDDESTYNGSTGCTQVILQRLVAAKTGRVYSQDQISQIAGYPWPNQNPTMRGLYSGTSPNSEVNRVIRAFDLPYEVKFGLSWASILRHAAKGPVMLGVRYGFWPEMQGYRYGNVKADGKPGGWAFRNGKTQLFGFEQGYHATLFLGTRQVKRVSRAYCNDPNHGSPARPEKPDWDTIRTVYLRRAYEEYGSTGRSLLAWVPTETFRPRGYR